MLNRRDVLRNISWLAGGAVITPALLHSCNNEPELGWKPGFFSSDEARFLESYIDTLLPKTDTPGGLEVGVHQFIDRVMAATNTDTEDLLPMQMGMRNFDDDAKNRFGKVFYELEADQRGQLFSDAEKAPRYQPAVWGTAVGEQPPVGFYRSLKSMVLWGYLSSERIGREVLVYDPVPGEYDGDMPLSETGGRSWSL